MGELDFLEVGLDPKIVIRNERKSRGRRCDVVADLELLDFGDDAVARRGNNRVGQIELCAVEQRARLLDGRVLIGRDIRIAAESLLPETFRD